MGFFDLCRVPEPEVMDDAKEVQAYSSAAAQRHLDKIDDTFVDRALRLLKGRERGCALDIGTGPGQIVLKLASRLQSWKFIAVDRSPNMIAQARANSAAAVAPAASRVNLQMPDGSNLHAADAPDSLPAARSSSRPQGIQEALPQGVDSPLEGRVEFQVADGNHLEFADHSFDFVMCNSVLHHLAQPKNLLAEMERLAKPDGAILLRDLRRPSRLAYPLHVRWHGRHYRALMYRLYCDSVLSAYTESELRSMLASSALTGSRVFLHGTTHLGIERPASR